MAKEAVISVKRAYPVRRGVNYSYSIVYKGNAIVRGKDFRTLAMAENAAIGSIKQLISKNGFPKETIFRINIYLGKESVPYFSNVGTVKELEFEHEV